MYRGTRNNMESYLGPQLGNKHGKFRTLRNPRYFIIVKGKEKRTGRTGPR